MSPDIHAQATDLLCKALAAPSDQLLQFIEEVLRDAELASKDRKKVQEVARKVCTLRDQLAIQLYDLDLVDPRQLALGFDTIMPKDFAP